MFYSVISKLIDKAIIGKITGVTPLTNIIYGDRLNKYPTDGQQADMDVL